MRPDKIFLSLAFCALLLITGAWLYRKFVARPRVSTKIEWYEKRIEIPAKVEIKRGTDLPTSQTSPPDTVWLSAPCDSVRDWAMRRMRPFTTTFEDTIGFADSLLSFSAREVTAIEADPWTRLITKARRFEDAILKAARVETTETVTETDWLVTLGAFIIGIVLALALS